MERNSGKSVMNETLLGFYCEKYGNNDRESILDPSNSFYCLRFFQFPPSDFEWPDILMSCFYGLCYIILGIYIIYIIKRSIFHPITQKRMFYLSQFYIFFILICLCRFLYYNDRMIGMSYNIHPSYKDAGQIAKPLWFIFFCDLPLLLLDYCVIIHSCIWIEIGFSLDPNIMKKGKYPMFIRNLKIFMLLLFVFMLIGYILLCYLAALYLHPWNYLYNDTIHPMAIFGYNTSVILINYIAGVYLIRKIKLVHTDEYQRQRNMLIRAWIIGGASLFLRDFYDVILSVDLYTLDTYKFYNASISAWDNGSSLVIDPHAKFYSDTFVHFTIAFISEFLPTIGLVFSYREETANLDESLILGKLLFDDDDLMTGEEVLKSINDPKEMSNNFDSIYYKSILHPTSIVLDDYGNDPLNFQPDENKKFGLTILEHGTEIDPDTLEFTQGHDDYQQYSAGEDFDNDSDLEENI